MSNIRQRLDCIVIEPKTHATQTVIWLHGLGARGRDFAKLVPKLSLPKQSGIRFIFPTAPERTITLRGHKVATAWYDIMKVSPGRIINMEQMEESIDWIQALIQEEIDSGIPSEHITLIGFSQGGAVTYEAATRFTQPLKQLIALSTYLPRQAVFSPANQQLPIHIFHGDKDTMVPYQLGVDAYEALKVDNKQVKFYRFPIRHEVSRDLIKTLSELLSEPIHEVHE